MTSCKTLLRQAQSRDEKTVVELAAIATFLHNTYNGMENLWLSPTSTSFLLPFHLGQASQVRCQSTAMKQRHFVDEGGDE